VLEAPPVQLIYQYSDENCPCRADRMSHRDGAACDIYAIEWHSRFFHEIQNYGSESLVNFEKIDIAKA
jgi:hypothetical protein